MTGPVVQAEAPPSESQLKQLADSSFVALRTFVLTGDQASRMQFLDLWTRHNQSDAFYNRFIEKIGAEPQIFTPLLNAYKQAKGEFPAADQLANAVQAYYAEMGKPKAQRDIEAVRQQYGGAFVSEMDKVSAGPAAKAAPKPVMATPAKVEAPTPEAQMKQLADSAYVALRTFVLTGDQASRTQFMDLWAKHNANDAFYNRFIEKVGSQPEVFSNLLNAYKEAKGDYPMANELAGAVQAYYAEMGKPAEKRDLAQVRQQYGDAFVAEMDRIMAATASTRPVRIPAQVDDQTLTRFIGFLKITDVKPNAALGEKAHAVVMGIKDSFGIPDFAQAEEVTRAMLHAYLLLGGEDQKQFGTWLGQLDATAKTALTAGILGTAQVRRIKLPHETVKAAFDTWKKAKESEQDKIAALEAELRRYPTYIKEGNLKTMASEFTNAPTDFGLERISQRVEYLRKRELVLKAKGDKKSGEDLRKQEAEIKELETWLEKFGAKSGSAEVRIDELRQHLFTVQALYFEMSSESMSLVDYMASLKPRPALSALQRRYLAALDARAIGIFTKIPPDSPVYLDRLRDAINTNVSSSRAKDGQAQWYTDYFPQLAPSRSDVGQNPLVAQVYTRVAQLDPVSAVSFLDYLKVATDKGVVSLEEKKLVVASVARLYALHPALLVKYFQAIKNLAGVCENNPEAFREALVALSARIDMETDPVLSSVSPTQIIPINIRMITTRLERALGEIGSISRAAMSQYDRLNLLDDNLYLRQYQPHIIEQKAPRYAPKLLMPPPRVGTYNPAYPFPPLQTPTPALPFSGGALTTSPQTYGGQVQLPRVNLFSVMTGATNVGASMENYLYPRHPVVNISAFLPGVNIAPVSITKLLNEINKAFIPTELNEYSRQVISGGAAGGFAARKPADGWEYGGGGMGAVLTPTGGAAIGGAGDRSRIFAGATAVAVPVAIPIITGPPGQQSVTGLDSLVGGYQETDPGQKDLLLRAIQTQWTPDNPRQGLVVVNRKEDVAGKAVMTARYYYIEKDGTIFELKGGTNDYVKMLNFLAGYGNQNFDTPSTYAWNVEPSVDRGGGALVIDLGRTAELGHFQAVPLLLPERTDPTSGRKIPPPLLMEWTAGFAVSSGGGESPTWVHQPTYRGKMLTLHTVPSTTGGPAKQEYILHDIDYMIRRVDKRDAIELTLGGGYADTPLGYKGKGGIFFKYQERQYPNVRAGGGLFYEAGATNLDALALMDNSVDSRRYIESLHRIGATVYGSREMQSRLVVGGLLHGIEQLKEARESGDLSHDQFFWRAVGLMKGIKSAARLDLVRFSNLDQMLTEYETLSREVGNDPSRASALVSDFQTKYGQEIQRVFDNYYLGIQINKDFSLEASLLMRETENTWTSQVPDTAAGRMLVTWNTGFWRMFAAIPLLGAYGLSTPQFQVQGATGSPRMQSVGMVGTGVGQDLFNGVWMQRFAADVGLLVARYEDGDKQWMKEGFFTQGALKVFSNVVEDASAYRRLVEEYERYSEAVLAGRFSAVPESVRSVIAANLNEDAFAPVIIEAIKDGKDVKLTELQSRAAEEALWQNWFYDKKYDLQQKFDGHLRVFLAGSGYFFSDRTYWDVGTFLEYVNRFKGYLIMSQRSKLGVYAGAEAYAGRWTFGAMAGVSGKGGGGAGSVRFRLGPRDLPVEVGVVGFGRSDSVPDYAPPAYLERERTFTPEMGFMFTIGIGSTGPQIPIPQQPAQGTGGRF
jgi:hypothetical protein